MVLTTREPIQARIVEGLERLERDPKSRAERVKALRGLAQYHLILCNLATSRELLREADRLERKGYHNPKYHRSRNLRRNAGSITP